MADGCIDRIVQLIEDNAVIVAAVALGITALEVRKTTSYLPPHTTYHLE